MFTPVASVILKQDSGAHTFSEPPGVFHAGILEAQFSASTAAVGHSLPAAKAAGLRVCLWDAAGLQGSEDATEKALGEGKRTLDLYATGSSQSAEPGFHKTVSSWEKNQLGPIYPPNGNCLNRQRVCISPNQQKATVFGLMNKQGTTRTRAHTERSVDAPGAGTRAAALTR
ncbi:hypothetical protein E5288_WYG022698 [Bos mutus]|uniref:Uncharacterized protein n=1 Tax=Bos mutus TaxID=72004 RepID=A0A6B0QYZ0_9CETA|nr:hypothetical protein [Bos mutus]